MKKSKNKSTTKKSASSTKPKVEKATRFNVFKWLKSRGIVFKFALFFILCMVITSVVVGVLVVKELPSPTRLTSQAYPVSTIIMDRNGETLYEIYADTNRSPIELTELPEYVSQATISIEDKNFYSHFGFSIQGITRALKNNLFGDSLQGGSTISQQLVKVALLSPERTWQRKFKEAILTIGTEAVYTKDEILEMYLNHIPYGGTAWGIESAAKTYFGKSAKDLTLAEAALLAGLPAAPSRFSPFGANPELAIARQQEVLRRMAEEGYITQEQADEAKSQKLVFATDQIKIRAPHFSLYVKDLLTEKYGLEMVERGGLRVITSLDLEIQDTAQASLSAEIDELEQYKVTNGAALITKPNTGEILAMVGSRDYFNKEFDGQVNVTTQLRQPGSSIKPINYAIAMELKKITPATMLLDVPTCFTAAGTTAYCPKNYDGSFHGPVHIRHALGNSYNIPAVKTLALNGLETFIASASAMGITTFKDPSQYGLSLTLGGGEVRMLDMATAFGVLANQGVKVPLQPILKVTNWKGEVLEEYNPEEAARKLENLTYNPELQDVGNTETVEGVQKSVELTRVLHRAPAYLISDILQDNNARMAAFGPRSELVIPGQVVSVKTGTTNNLRDNWTIGYTPEYLTAVWVGNNDNTPMNQFVVSGVTGAAPIFNDLMSFVLEGKEPVEQDRPEDVITRSVCVTTGLVSHPDSPCQTRSELFWEGTEPGVFEQTTKEIWVKADNGQQPAEGDTDNLKLERKVILSDPFTPDYCLDCARPTDEEGKPQEPVQNVPMQ